jgi:hypothetical protein
VHFYSPIKGEAEGKDPSPRLRKGPGMTLLRSSNSLRNMTELEAAGSKFKTEDEYQGRGLKRTKLRNKAGYIRLMKYLGTMVYNVWR